MYTEGKVITGIKARRYEWFQSFRGAHFIYRNILKTVQLKPGQSVLDIGCGPGTVLFRLSDMYGGSVHLHGIDPSPDMISGAMAKNDFLQRKIDFQEAAGEKLPFADNTFDWIITSLAMHHLPYSTKRLAIQEMHRVLKQNGSILVVDFGPSKNMVGMIVRFFLKNHAFASDNFGGAVRDLLEQSGFRNVQLQRVQLGAIHHLTAQK